MITRQYSSDMQFTEEIRRKADIAEVISRRLSLTKAGRGWMSACPFHLDRSISFHVFTDTQNWRCFGCATGGDVINFVMRADGLTFGEASHRLGIEFGLARTNLPGGETDRLDAGPNVWDTADERDGSRDSQRQSIQKYSDLIRKLAAEKRVPGDRETPIDQEAYMTLTGFRRKELESRLRGDDPPNVINLENRLPVLGNLAYHKGLEDPRLRTVVSDLQPGLVIAYFHNLQEHILLEEASGKTRIADAADYRDAGRCLWLENQGTALIKDLQTGRHSDEISIDGVTDRGFVLLRPKGQRNHSWFIPRSPRGGNRRTYLADGSIFALESFDLDTDVLPGYTDISGDFVKLQAANRCSLRHQHHLGLGH